MLTCPDVGEEAGILGDARRRMYGLQPFQVEA